MNAIPCTPRHEKQDDTFASWENLPAGVMASLSQRTVGLDWCCYCRWCTHMGQRASEAGSEEKDDWQGQDAERQLSGWHWQTAGEEIAKKFCGRNYALNFTHFKGVTCQHEDEHEAEIYRWMKDGKIIHQSLFLPISVPQKDLPPMINAKSACMIQEGSNGSTSPCI